jgi:hypothetical protein
MSFNKKLISNDIEKIDIAFISDERNKLLCTVPEYAFQPNRNQIGHHDIFFAERPGDRQQRNADEFPVLFRRPGL